MNQLFTDLEILDQTKQALEDMNLVEPTQIQSLAIPKMIEGLDIIAQAKTGTGKTFAFAIPILEKINFKNKKIQAVILTPTRELALQVYKEIVKLVKYYKEITVIPIVGGESYTKQFANLKKNPHIIVATPGRLIDHLDRNTIDLSSLEVLTLDEADEMLKMGFQEDIERILKETPKTRQTVLFSATIPPFIKKIATNYQKNPITVKVEADSLTVDKIIQNYYMVKEKDKKQLLIRLIDYLQPKSAIIFANTKKDVDEITEFLQKNKYSADGLHGDLKQTQRSYVMNNFRNNNTKFLVATDVAARGLDVENIELVINYDVPHELEVYVHRIGRTGRAGSKGESYTFITPRKARFSSEIEKFTNSKMFLKQIPSKEDIESKQNYNFIKELKQRVNKNESNNDNIINNLISEGFTERAILNALIEDIKPSTNRYKKIDIIETKKNKNQGRSNSNMLTVAVNIGKKERLTPDVLLKLLRKEYNIDSRFVGNIKHLQDETKFEISDRDLKKINTNKKVVFKGKRIKFKMSK